MSFSHLSEKLRRAYEKAPIESRADRKLIEKVLENLNHFSIELESLYDRHGAIKELFRLQVIKGSGEEGIKRFQKKIAEKKDDLLAEIEGRFPELSKDEKKSRKSEITALEKNFIGLVLYPEHSEEVWNFLNAEMNNYFSLRDTFSDLIRNLLKDEKFPLSKNARDELDALNTCITFTTQMISHKTASAEEISAFHNKAKIIQERINDLKPSKERMEKWSTISSGIGFGAFVLSLMVGIPLIATGVGIPAGIGIIAGGIIAVGSLMPGVGGFLEKRAHEIGMPLKRIKQTHAAVTRLFDRKTAFDEKHGLKVTKEKLNPKKS
jgi:hypothetical protein